MATSIFKTKRRPDHVSSSMTLDEHISIDNPHPQYLKKTDLTEDLDIDITGVLTILTDRSMLPTGAQKHLVGAGVINAINVDVVSLSDHYEDLSDAFSFHKSAFTQEQALSTSTLVTTDHVDNNGLNLYAARTHNHDTVYSQLDHSHTLESLGAASADHTHEQYSIDDHNHDSRYPTRRELSDVGIYPTVLDIGFRDLNHNTYLVQGCYYFEQSSDPILNGPDGMSSGMVQVYRCGEETAYITQIAYTQDISWKREIEIADTGTVFGKWKPLNESLPIGSVLFMNTTETPEGYVEANGSEITIAAYPSLWDHVITQNKIYLYEDWLNKYPGCYGFSDTIITSQKTIDESDIDSVFVKKPNNDNYELLTSDNIGTYSGQNCYYVNKESVVSFRLPYLSNKFIKMYTQNESVSFGKYEEAGLPNVRAYFQAPIYNNGSVANMGGAVTFGSRVSLAEGGDEYPFGLATFDASKGTTDTSGSYMSQSDSPYGKSNTVTPENISIRVFIKAYNGSILHESPTQATIEDIVQSELGKISYATTTTNGLVKLAPENVVFGDGADDPARPSVITAAQLKTERMKNVHKLSVNGVEYSLSNGSNTITLPNLALAEGNTDILLTMEDEERLTCLLDSAVTMSFRDYVIPRINSPYFDDVNLQYSNVSVALQCINGANNLGYPEGAIVLNPMCSNKAANNSEYMSSPSVVVYRDTGDYYDGTTISKIIVRVFWPIAWYIKKFIPEVGDDVGKTYPLTTTDLSQYSIAEIRTLMNTACSYWKLLINIKL